MGGGGDLLQQTPVTSGSFPRGNLDMADVESSLGSSLHKSWWCALEWMGYVYLRVGLDTPRNDDYTPRVEVVSRLSFENWEQIRETQCVV